MYSLPLPPVGATTSPTNPFDGLMVTGLEAALMTSDVTTVQLPEPSKSSFAYRVTTPLSSVPWNCVKVRFAVGLPSFSAGTSPIERHSHHGISLGNNVMK